MKTFLKAKPQCTVMDTDNSTDLNASDAVNFVVRKRKAGKQELVAGIKPIEHITYNL